MRLVDMDEVEKSWERELRANFSDDYGKGFRAGLTAVIRHPTTEAAPAPRWIPVTERLPELIPCNAGTAYSEAVIVWTDGKKAMIAVWDGINFLCAADYWEAWGENITHWMPLPACPEDGGNDNVVD